MTGTFGFMIELLVAGLLLVTIGYCAVLDRRLRAVRQDEQMMRKTVVDLSAATERAERAIESLRHTLGDCDRTLAERLRVAERYTTDLEDQIRSGDDVLTRISRIVSTTQDSILPETGASASYRPVAPSLHPHHHPAASTQAQAASGQMTPPRPVVMPVQPGAPFSSRISQTLAAAHNLAAHANSRVQEPHQSHQPYNGQSYAAAPAQSPYATSHRDHVA